MHFNSALKYNIVLKSINVLILFFINIIFVRIAGAENSGNFFYLLTILSFLTLIVSGSLETGIAFYTSKNLYISSSLAWFIIVIAIAQIAFSYFIIAVLVKNSTSLSQAYLLLFLIGNIFISSFSSLYFSHKWFVIVNAIILSINCVLAGLLLLIFLQKKVSLINWAEKLYTISYCAQAVVLMICFFVKDRIHKWSFPSIIIIRRIFIYSLLALTGNLIFFLVTRLDYVFVKIYCLPTALGNYVQVSKIGQFFVLFPAMAASVIFPYSASGDGNILPKVQWLTRFITMIFIVSAAILVIAGKWMLPWFFGKEFYLMYNAILFYLPGIFGLSVSALLASHISGKGSVLVNVKASAIALLIVIGGDIIFIPKYGINAAAAVSSIAYLSCMLYLLKYCIKKYHTELPTFFYISFSEFKYIFSHITHKK